jgi:LacI family transcriptional regulator
MGITLKDVAREAGISIASASAALHGSRGDNIRVSPATRERILKVAAELGYVGNQIAKSLATGKTRTVGLMLPYVEAFVDENPFCSQVMHGVLEEAICRHYNLILYTAADGTQSRKFSQMIDNRVDGVLLVMPSDSSEVFARCESQQIPFVSVLTRREENVWGVNADDYRGGLLAGRHLLSLGHRRIAHLAGSDDVPSTVNRALGFRDALLEGGIEAADIQVVQSGFSSHHGHKAMARILRRPQAEWPSAIFACNDLCAEGAIRAIREKGLTVPEDIAIVGFDDTWFAAMTQPPLTTIHMPIKQMGKVAAKMLIDRLEEIPVAETSPILEVSLTIRGSCGAQAGVARLPN